MALNSALMDQINLVVRRLGYARSTAKTYRSWCENYMIWLKQRDGKWTHPRDTAERDVTAWLEYLGNVRNVSPTSQNVALQAVLFLFRNIIGRQLQNIDAMRAKRPQRLPTFLSVPEVSRLFAELKGRDLLIGQLLYGCGLRIGEAMSLRTKDVNLDDRQIVIRSAKGAKDRAVGIPRLLVDKLARQIDAARRLHQQDVEAGTNRVELPYSYGRKSRMAAGSFAWFWLFPSHKLSRHPEERWIGRYHIDKGNFARSLRLAAKRAQIDKPCNPHCLRHSYATHSLNQGIDIRSLQQLMGHSDVRTTMKYTHVYNAGATSEQSPLDRLPAA